MLFAVLLSWGLYPNEDSNLKVPGGFVNKGFTAFQRKLWAVDEMQSRANALKKGAARTGIKYLEA